MIKHKYNSNDIVKSDIGILIYIKDTEKRSSGGICGLWKCFCGQEFISNNSNITIFNTRSCGCHNKKIIEQKIIDPSIYYLYLLHKRIKSRCYSKTNKNYNSYGGRGIIIQESWKNNKKLFVSELLEKIGHRPTVEHQLDRINTNGNYELNNIKWSTPKENCRNKNNNHLVEINNQIKTLSEWSEISGINEAIIRNRIKLGWTSDQLLDSVKIITKSKEKKPIFYQMWKSIKQRCFNKNSKSYHRYGGRGITLFKSWIKDYKAFEKYLLDNLGNKPTANHQLDRKNNDGNYEPGNLRWSTPKENCNNTSVNRFITINGITKTISEWAEFSNIKPHTILKRLKNGKYIDENLLLKSQKNKRKFDNQAISIIRQEFAEGATVIFLIKKYKADNGTIINILLRRGAYLND